MTSLDNLTIKKAYRLLESKKISSSELSDYYFEKIKKEDKNVNVFVTLKKAVKRKKSNTQITGIPYAAKDNYLTRGVRTTASSMVLDNYVPQYNATVIDRLEGAGAVLIGKTNMDAWAHGSSTETSDYGVTRNPWGLDRVAGGSSGGSAAAVAADFCTFAIGSETAGSIRGPAAWCGCVGLKPTYGRVSRYGVIAMGSSLDCPGPLTRTVRDAAMVLQKIAGGDKKDATTSQAKVPNYLRNIDKGVEGLNIALAENYLIDGMSEQVKESIEQTLKIFEKMGAKIHRTKTMDPKYAISDYTIIQRSEVSSNLSRYDGIRYGNPRKFFGEEATRRITLGTFALSEGYSKKYYKKALKVRNLFIKDFKKLFEKYDVIIGPSMPGPAPKVGVTKGAAMFGEMADMLNEPSSLAGLPGISVPCGFEDGLPLGLNIMVDYFREDLLLQTAYSYEKESGFKNIFPKK